MSLSVKLPLFLGALTAIIATTGSTLLVRQVREALIDQRLTDASQQARSYAAAVSAHLADSKLAIEMGAADAEVAGFEDDSASAQAYAERLLAASDIFEYVMLADRHGTVVVVAPGELAGPLTQRSLAQAAWFRASLASGETEVSDLHISPATRRPSVAITAPVRDPSGAMVGVLLGGLGLGPFSEFATAGTAGSGAGDNAGLLTDRRGLIVAHQGNPTYVTNQTDFSSVPAVRSALEGRSGAGRWYNPIERTEKLGAYRPLPQTGWAVVVAVPVDDALAPVRRITKTTITVSLVATTLLFVLGAALARHLTRPLRQLARASMAVASGDLGVRAEVRGGEVGLLASRFNEMLDALNDNERQLEERARALERTNEELEAFGYSVSHDLRAPLRAIDGFGQILVEDFGSSMPPEAREHLDRIRAATRRMGDLIGDMLTLARVGAADLQISTVDLSALASSIVAERLRAEPNRRVSISIDPGLTTSADPRLAEVVLLNLLGNAWKFTGTAENPHISVKAAAEPGWFVVADNGVGFDMTHAGHLFEPFRRLHTASAFPGTGVGLATVRRILNRHGGQILAEAAPGRGATFTFTFQPSSAVPSASEPGAAREHAPDGNRVTIETSRRE